MSRWKKLLRRAKEGPANLSFDDLCKIAELAGFEERDRRGGSHVIYKHPDISDISGAMCNFQSIDGKAKPYQVRQLLEKIELYQLGPAEEAEDEG